MERKTQAQAKCLGLKIRWPKPNPKDTKLRLRPINQLIGRPLLTRRGSPKCGLFVNVHKVENVNSGGGVGGQQKPKTQFVNATLDCILRTWGIK